jgi:CubicO group peptidase (beta-lactamase class C family)
MRMRQTQFLMWFHLVFAVAAVIACPSNAQQGQGPCQHVQAACRAAGFVPGGAREGTGILIDCIRPIVQGTGQRPKATKPLPQIDANVVQACKSADPSFGQQETPVVHELSAPDIEAFLDPLIIDQLARLKIAGAVAVVVKDNGILFARGYGYADVENKRRMTADATLVRPGSISKLFTGIAVMQLVEQGKLDLDRDVNDYLDFHIPTPDGGVPVTLRRLMTHRAGFEEHIKGLFSADRTPEPLGHWLSRSLPRRLFPAGDVPAYSNFGMALAGYIVERASGKPYADYAAEHILQPLGMVHATFRQPLPDDLAPLMAKSYRWFDGTPWLFFETIAASPAGALSATGIDMGRFMLALLHGGSLDGNRVLSELGLATMMAPQIATPAGSMGLVFLERKLGGIRFVGHDGGTMSFFSALMVSPERGLGVFISYDGGGIALVFRDLLPALFQAFAKRYLPAVPAETSLSTNRAGDTGATAGVYQNSRRADSTFARLSALTSELLVRPIGEGGVTIHSAKWPFGADQSLQQVGELLFRGPKGEEIAFEPVSAWAMRFNIGAAQQWQRVPWYLDVRIVGPAIIVSVLVNILTVVSWPFAAINRRWHGHRWSKDVSARRCHLTARLILLLQLAVIVIVCAIFVAATLNPTILNDALDPALIALYACAWLSVFGSFIALWIAWQFLRKRVGGRWARLHHYLMAASTITVAWFFLNWHIAGTTLNY